MAADHVDADEQQAALPELGSKRRADFLLARRELGLRGRAADGKVGANFAFARDAVDRARDLAVDEHDALVALGDLGEEFLHDVRLAIGLVEQLHQRGEIAAVGADAEHRSAGEAVQRLDHDLAMLGEEFPGEAERARDRRRRHELREVEHPQLLRRIANACRIVDHQGLALDPLEQVRGGDVAEVERRILPHQDDIDVAAEVEDLRLAEAVMVAGDALDGDRIAHRPQAALGPAERVGRVMVERVAELLRLEHDGEGGIAGDVDPLERVHLHCDAERHGAGA